MARDLIERHREREREARRGKGAADIQDEE